MTEVGEIIFVHGRAERVVERGPIKDNDGITIAYYLATEPLDQDGGQARELPAVNSARPPTSEPEGSATTMLGASSSGIRDSAQQLGACPASS